MGNGGLGAVCGWTVNRNSRLGEEDKSLGSLKAAVTDESMRGTTQQ